MVIPYQRLSEEALMGVVEEFITREGTDYGHTEVSFDDKRRAVLQQLRSGRAYIEFDPGSETCTLRARR
ncbi:MAG: YheU family protein [Myxococcales bacterium]|nr:YheU family protein [Myxococcales bacterium]